MLHQLLQFCRTLSAGACTANSFHTCRKKEKRKLDESLRKVKTLGQADEDIDDLAKWVTSSRTRGEEEKELAREEALAAVRRQAEEVFGHSLSLSVGSDPLCISHQFEWFTSANADEIQQSLLHVLHLCPTFSSLWRASCLH